jgi:simple sugar transport system ATP-binding protein
MADHGQEHGSSMTGTYGSDPIEGVPVLEARGLVKRYGHVEAMRGANFTVYAGELVALVGDNGAGKSTLVKMLSGAVAPDAGRILYEGEPVAIPTPAAARALGIETVYQDLALANELDPAMNVFMGRELRRRGLLGRLGFIDRPEMRRQARDAFGRLGVTADVGRRSVGALSGGQRQGVAVARAVTWADKVIFMDEPTAALGAVQRTKILELMRRVVDQGLSVVLISHDLPQVVEVADRVEVLRLGRRVGRYRRADVTVESLLAAMTGAVVQEEEDHDGAA